MKRTDKRRGTSWFIKYNGMFLIAALALVACFALQGKYMVGMTDGVHQHYTTLAYIRSMLLDLLRGNGFKMVDLQLGQGLDVIGTLSYYGLADPLNLITLFFTESTLEYAYALLIYMRMYLVGLFFCIYLRKIRIENSWAVSLAGFILVFSGFFIKGTPRHPYFANGSIYLALMLIATERFLRDRKWLMFSLITALMLVVNYYFAFKTTLLVIVYIIIRLAFNFRERGLKRSALDGASLLGAYVLGALLTAVYFLPVIINYMGNARLDVESGYRASLLFFPLLYYIRLFAGFTAPYLTAGAWVHANFCPAVIFGLLLCFAKRRRELPAGDGKLLSQLRTVLVVMFVFLCVPAVGKLFNGMGYVCNRWCYGPAFAICAAFAWALPELMDPENSRNKRFAVIAMIYAALVAAAGAIVDPMLMIAGAVATVIFALFFLLLKRCAFLQGKWAMRVLAVLVVGCCIAYECAVYLPVGGTLSDDFGRGSFYNTLNNETSAAASAIEDEAFFRVDTGDSDDCHQSVQGYHGTGVYWSVIPNHVSGYYRALELPTMNTLYRISGLGASAALNSVAAVGYSLRNGKNDQLLPYGYTQIDTVEQADGDQVSIYRNDYALPLGYVFEETMDEADYLALGPVEKQAALLDRAVLADSGAALPRQEAAQPVEWTLTESNGVEIGDGRIDAKRGGTFTMRFEGIPDSETYFVLDGLIAEKTAESGVFLQFKSEAGLNIGRVSDPTSNFYFDQRGLCVNLGYSADGLTECTIRFNTPMQLRYDSIGICCLPMAYYRESVGKLRENGMRDIVIENNRISGSVDTARGGVLQIAVPYSEGWSAKIDGADTELLRCGGMYAGVALDAGRHSIELNYVTPGLKAGACCSAAAILLLALALIVTRKKRVR